jgi:hypothetical protein
MARPKHVHYFLILFLLVLFEAKAQYEPSAAPALKTFALNSDLLGGASNSVNLFTGDVALPISLLSLPGRNGLDINIGISYSSQVQQAVNKWNLEAPTGILGLGWGMDLPKIVCDHKQTGTRIDDEYYLVEGGISNKMVRTIAGSDAQGNYYVYETLNYQFWRIRYYYDPVEYGSGGSGANKWEIVKEDGTKVIYGDQWSNRKTVQWMVKWGNWIGSSAQTQGQSRMAFVWNLSEVINLWGEKVTYEYIQEEQFVGSVIGVKHTEASYISKITNPQGQSIVFDYKDKQHPYYLEPHIEKPEPDAYQEFYEKKYLDFVEVKNQSNAKMLEVSFKYGNINSGTTSAKMLLTGIIQKNASGTALPGLSFQYSNSGNFKGMLEKVIYPGGGSVTYTYGTQTIARSNRELSVQAPSGYAEPKVWVADDYTVVAWRQLGSGGVHTDAAQNVKIFAYQWVGEWKGQELATLNNVILTGDNNTKDYKDFYVVTQPDFFGIMSRATSSSTSFNVWVYQKSREVRAAWDNKVQTSIALGSGTPYFSAGNHYVVAGIPERNTTFTGGRIFSQRGDSWQMETLGITLNGKYNYGAANNFIFSQHYNSPTPSTTKFDFHYLSEDRKWNIKTLNSTLTFLSNKISNWNCSESMAFNVNDGHFSEYVYRWSIDYNTFFRDANNKLGNHMFPDVTGTPPAFVVDNSLVGIKRNAARFDGKEWTSVFIPNTPIYMHDLTDYISYGNDYLIFPAEKLTYGTAPDVSLFNGGRFEFDPNTLSWKSPFFKMEGANSGHGSSFAGIDYYYFGNGYYYRDREGVWSKIQTSAQFQGIFNIGGYPRFNLRYLAASTGTSPNTLVDFVKIEKGIVESSQLFFGVNRLLRNLIKYKSNGVGINSFVLFNGPYANSPHEDATNLKLCKFVSENFTTTQTDFYVQKIGVFDGNKTTYHSFDYHAAKAIMDPAGLTAQYHEVTEIPGSQTAANKPYGSIKHYFGNGLTATELGFTHDFSNLQWTGALYKKDILDAAGIIKGYERTVMNVFTKNLVNDISSSVETARYSRPVEVMSLAEGIFSNKYIYFSNLTGLPTHDILVSHDSKPNSLRTDYRYFWEAYNPARDLNILSPVIQTKQTIAISGAGSVVNSSQATTWKQWNGTSVFGPHKTYTWRRSSSPDFDFTNHSNQNEPGSTWQKISEINAVNTAGQVIQVTKH